MGKSENGMVIYPPLVVKRQNETHLLRVVIDSLDMIKLLQENYATPINSNRPKFYFDINTNFNETKLIASTNIKYLEVVDGYDNPHFYRRAKLINKGKRKGRSNLGDDE